MRTSMLAGALLTAAAALVAGCGDTDDSSFSSETTESTAPSQTTEGSDTTAAPDDSAAEVVEVVAEDITFPEDSYEATAGTVRFRYVNDGAILHTLVIEDVDGFKLEVAAAGDEDEGTAELEAGSYVLFCDVPGHRGAGMEATLDVS